MFNLHNSGKPEIDKFVHTFMSSWDIPAIIDSYAAQSQLFMLKRMQLQARIMLIVVLTIIVFFVWVNSNPVIKLSTLKAGLVIEAFILACWFLCQNLIGRRYPHLIFLSLCWSVTCAAQIDTALILQNFEPRVNMWMLMFVAQATIIPVMWRLHLTSQVVTIICYLFLYWFTHPILKRTLAHYVEQGLYLFWTCTICNISVSKKSKLLVMLIWLWQDCRFNVAAMRKQWRLLPPSTLE